MTDAMKKETILIDIDDTIENLCEEWCNTLNRVYGLHVSYQDITEWDISRFFPGIEKDQVYAPLHSAEIWHRLKPRGEAVKYVKQLMDDGYDVYLCTTSDYRNVKPKYEGVIQRYFPYIKWSQVIVTSHKQMIKADFLVDDGVHNLEGGDYAKILMTTPANKSYDAAKNGMFRADNWQDVYRIIRSNSVHE